MHMRVMMQVLAPGMEHGDDADLGAEMLGVGRDGAQSLCLCRRLEQDGVDQGFVLESDLCGGRGQREHNMEVRHRQQLGLPGGEPFRPGRPLALRTMPVAARVVGVADQPAGRADLGMAAEFRRSAQFDRAHHAPFDPAEVSCMRLAIGITVAAEDRRTPDTPRFEQRDFPASAPIL